MTDVRHQEAQATAPPPNRLERPRRGDGPMIAGVLRCPRARRFGISTFLIRVLFVIFGLVGAGQLVYLILWLLIPRAPH